jgi:hypothetical protein
MRWDEAEHATVERVVRAGNFFSGKLGGEIVKVEPQHISGRNVQQATMSLEEAQNKPFHAGRGPGAITRNLANAAKGAPQADDYMIRRNS